MSALLLRFAPQLGIGALIIILGLGAALGISRAQLDHVRRDLTIEQALHATDVANFKAAQAKADADWQAEIARVQADNRRKNDEADRQTAAARSDYLARVMRLPAATDPGLSFAGALPGADFSQGPDGPGGDTILLARSDVLICATNTARLGAAHDWAAGFASP
jgi:hypothetical protein